ncbi:hypothetical protein JW926_01745 [Candidatus Sumerlaeota bacterium]|nr:hypothetical protein [Candidatus Sumerlaeota bacterium]
MNKRYLFLGILGNFLCAVFLNAAFASPVWMPLLGDAAPEGTSPTITVQSWDINATVIDINIHGFWVDEITTASQTFKIIRLPAEDDALTSYGLGNYGYYMNPGKSELPVMRPLVGVVSDATTITITSIQEMSPPIILNNFRIYPFQGVFGVGQSKPTFQYDPAHYASTQWYPYNPTSPPYSEMRYDIGMWHHCPVSQVEIFPFFVIPGTQDLKVVKEMRITLNHNGAPRFDIYNCSKVWWETYEKEIVNFGNFSHMFPGTVGIQKPKMLIYAPNSFQSSSVFDDFVRWKKRKGIPVTIKDADSYSSDYASLFNDIKTFYNNNVCYDIYILLIGDANLLTSGKYTFKRYWFDTSASTWKSCFVTVASDYYYARVNGDDDYGDVFIGRIPAKNITEMDDMLQKILNYEINPPSGNWPSQSLLCAHYDNAKTDNLEPGEDFKNPRFPDHKHLIAAEAYKTSGLSFTEVYGNQSGVSNASIINAVNNNLGFVNYNGHGDWDKWDKWHKISDSSYESFTVSNLDSLTSSAYTPIVFSTACYNGKFSKDSIAKEWLKKRGKGAVASLGSDHIYYTYPGHEWDRVLFCKAFGSDDHNKTANIGPLNAFTHIKAISYWNARVSEGTINSYFKNLSSANAYQCFLYGDPNLTLRTRPPRVFSVLRSEEDLGSQIKITFQVSWDTGESYMMIIKGASIVLEDNAAGDILATGYTDTGGSAVFTVNKGKDILFTIFAQDFYPSQDIIYGSSRVRDWKDLR